MRLSLFSVQLKLPSYKIYHDYSILLFVQYYLLFWLQYCFKRKFLYSIAIFHCISFFCLISFTFKPFPCLCFLLCINMQGHNSSLYCSCHFCVPLLPLSSQEGRLNLCTALPSKQLLWNLFSMMSTKIPPKPKEQIFTTIRSAMVRPGSPVSFPCLAMPFYYLPLSPASNFLWGTNQLFFFSLHCIKYKGVWAHTWVLQQ